MVHIEDHGINSHKREVRKAVKEAFASLRKAINTYRLLPEYAERYRSDERYSVKGNYWCLHKQLLLQFASWLEFTAPLETLLWEAKLHAEQQYYSFHEPYRVSQANVDNALRFFGLDHSATQEDLKRQYRQLVKLYHPDTGGDEATFKKLQTAHTILKTHLRSNTLVS
ncbi:J domain-containing protein [Dictyobacter vulcani]|nr:J domain-containing protein [Dictyobacter vulcani]